MRTLHILLIILAFFFAATSWAIAETFDYGNFKIKTPPGKVEQRNAALYVIKYSCEPKGNAKKKASPSLPGFSIFSNTTAFGFFITKGAQLATPASIDTNLSGSLATVPVSVVKTGSQETLFDFPECKPSKKLVVRGADLAALGVYYGTSTQPETTIIDGVQKLITDAVNPLVTLVVGSPLSALATSQIQTFTRATTAFGDFIKLFTFGDKSFAQVPLYEGTTTIDTTFSHVEITVSAVESLLLSSAPFTTGYKDLITGTAMSATEVNGTTAQAASECNILHGKWRDVGISNNIDIAFILYSEFVKLSDKKINLLHCLGTERALAAIPAHQYFNFIPGTSYTREDVIAELGYVPHQHPTYGQQPFGWNRLLSTMALLTETLGDASANGVPDGEFPGLLAEDKADLLSRFAPELVVEDETAGYQILKATKEFVQGGSDRIQGKPEKILAKLSDAGFRKWNCYITTESTDGQSLMSENNEPVVMLVWKATPEEELTPDSVGFAVRVFFENWKIKHLTITRHLGTRQVADAAKCNSLAKITVAAAPAN